MYLSNLILLLENIKQCIYHARPSKWSSGSNFSVLVAILAKKSKMLRSSGTVKPTQVSIDLPPMEPCTVCFVAKCGDVRRQLVTPNRLLKLV